MEEGRGIRERPWGAHAGDLSNAACCSDPTLAHPVATPAPPPPLPPQAVELGLDHAQRLSLRARLQAARLTCPLFDTAAWLRDFERTLQRMWAIHCEGRGPRDFDVGPAEPAAEA